MNGLGIGCHFGSCLDALQVVPFEVWSVVLDVGRMRLVWPGVVVEKIHVYVDYVRFVVRFLGFEWSGLVTVVGRVDYHFLRRVLVYWVVWVWQVVFCRMGTFVTFNWCLFVF